MENIIKELENAGKVTRNEFIAAFKLEQNGGIIIRKNGRYGWFDSEGYVKIPAMYIELKPIERGYVMAFTTGWIDLYNIYSLEPRIKRFTSVEAIQDFLKAELNFSQLYKFSACKSENNSCDSKEQYKKGRKLTSTYYMIVKDEKFGIINNNGEVLIEPECKSIIWVKEKYFVAEYDDFFKVYDVYGKLAANGNFASLKQAVGYTERLKKC